MDAKPLREHGDILSQLASMLHQQTSNQLGEGGWSKLYVDIRVPRSGYGASTTQYGASTTQYVLTNCERKILDMSGDASFLILDLVRSRKTLPGDPWYGCLIILTVEGECEVKYNYDKTCIDSLMADSRAGIPF